MRYIIIVTCVTQKEMLHISNKYTFIFYNLPSSPSRIRVSAWRAMKKIGALNIQQSLWLIPDFGKVESEIGSIKDSIERDGGNIFILQGNFNYGEKEIIEKFNEERGAEYEELLEYCVKFHEELKSETEKINFTFLEIEENEEELNKLKNWYKKIKNRDYFCCTKGKEAQIEIKKCEKELDEFTQNVYKNNNVE